MLKGSDIWIAAHINDSVDLVLLEGGEQGIRVKKRGIPYSIKRMQHNYLTKYTATIVRLATYQIKAACQDVHRPDALPCAPSKCA